MNIYAVEGHKVIVTEESSQNGYDYDSEKVAEHLEIGKEYEVEYTDVGGSHTTVKLKGMNLHFNSVNFEDVVEQDSDIDKEHHQYHRYT